MMSAPGSPTGGGDGADEHDANVSGLTAAVRIAGAWTTRAR